MQYSPWQFPHFSFFGVSGDTLVMTRDQGNVAISTLYAGLGQAVQAWNGSTWEQTTVGSAGLAQPLYHLTLSTGATLTVSAGYNWYTKSPSQPTFFGQKSIQAVSGDAVWPTLNETNLNALPPFPTVVSLTPTGTTGDLYYVASSTGLTLFNNVLASCGYPPEAGSEDPVAPPPV